VNRRTFLLSAAAAPLAAEEELLSAFGRMYNFDFPAAHRIVDGYVTRNPDEPLGYVARGSAYLFGEMDRLGILETDFFLNDDRISDKKKLKPDPKVRDAFYWATAQAKERSEKRLATNSNDKNALLAIAITYGMLTDYGAFVEKRQLASLSYAKQSQAYAVRLLAIDPSYADAHLTTGISEYLLGSLPFFVKWFVKFEQTKGSKDQAVRNLKVVAEKGRYFGPFARILLAVVALREKRKPEARAWLEGLVRDYPSNPLLRRELTKLAQHR